jgi:LAS superfamily LD-carboxypeptidase LdcB
MLLSSYSLTGRTESHLCDPGRTVMVGVQLHRDVVEPFLRLREAAAGAGFDLRILSGFRSFQRQLDIWNRKARGDLAVLDSLAIPLDIARLTDQELVFTILRWSALPGASRHHWGTEMDVFDEAARPEGYEVELVPEEVDPGGFFGPLHAWLDERMAGFASFGFYRPYDRDRGGVAPERWHLSYGPVADSYQDNLTTGVLRHVIEGVDMELKDVVLENLDEIYERFVMNVGRPST